MGFVKTTRQNIASLFLIVAMLATFAFGSVALQAVGSIERASAHTYETRCESGWYQYRYTYRTPVTSGGTHGHVWSPWYTQGYC